MKTRSRQLLPILLAVLLALLGTVYGAFRWYDSHVDRSGWVEKDGVRYYQDFHANKVSGWLELPEGTYYLEEGIPRTGWFLHSADTYYFADSGIMATGFLELDGKTHYFGANGHMVEGWLWLGADRYYLRDGALVTGWLELEDRRYYFGSDGILLSGFQTIDSSLYYFAPDGAMATGETEIEENTYLFGEDGVMFTGWQDTQDGRRYFRPDGPLAVGFLEMEDGLRYFGPSGIMAEGWTDVGEYRCHFDGEGIAAIGPTLIDGRLHYFTPKGLEVILVNALNPLPDYFDQHLIRIDENQQVDSRCYDALMQMLKDCNDAGIEYIFNSSYRTLETQTAILEYRTQEHMEQFGLNFEEGRKSALKTVAIPNTSEHQLGLSVDLLGKDAIAWLHEHCWDYGFILRYPPDKEEITGITDEDWHFRYVGTEVSMDMKDSGLCLEEYLGAEPITPERKQEAADEYLARSLEAEAA